MFAKIARSIEDINIKYQTLSDIPYMKKMVQHLEFIDAWPHKDLGIKRIMKYYIPKMFILYYLFATTGGSLYVAKHQKYVSFNKLGHIYITIFMGFLVAIRTAMTWQKSYKEVIVHWINRMHLFHIKNKSEANDKICKEVNLICVIFVKLMQFHSYGGGFSFCFIPITLNFFHGMYGSNRPPSRTFDNSVFYALPFDYETDLSGHLIVFTLNILAVIHCSMSCVAYDALLLVIEFHIWGHMRLLNEKLYSFPKPANSNVSPDITPFYTEAELVNVAEMLKDIVAYQKLLKDYSTEVGDAFGIMLLLNCVFQQISLCILLFECTGNDYTELIRFGIITVYVVQQTIAVSVTFELVYSESEKLTDAIYNIPWECMDTKNKRTVQIILMASQQSMDMKALGIITIGYKTMSSILKTTFSYFMLLRTLQK